MKRSSRFLLVAAIAALTFGTLNWVEGPKDWSYYHHHHHGWHDHDCHHYDYEDESGEEEDTL